MAAAEEQKNWPDPEEEFTEVERERGRIIFDTLEAMHRMGREGQMDALVHTLGLMTKDQLQGALIIATNALDLNELRIGRQVLMGDATS